MNTKKSIIVTGHADFAKGFKNAIKILLGEISQAHFIDLQDDFSSYKIELENLIQELSANTDKVFIFTDLANGSPFSVASNISTDLPNVKVFGGSNLAMVLETITQILYGIEKINTDEILLVGKESVTLFEADRLSTILND
ncbi:hypothetical protein AN640_02335 [Candidatus Epulonipiscium fishelsonii]|uniref:Uncharacterized protein n=1 Tax=Candidatus Epulonipiscium fishelsonii TaxID=77094 RepID=A0ACC8X909_9FIRM|nr:hypothetical protein AN640_02335 [Epulopiscium sp. SCG-D08WGA-EpuloA1]OON93736.1 MAG: hypothetical protein ATN32_08715 [Epulopiscium sp. AS2M-Bin002]